MTYAENEEYTNGAARGGAYVRTYGIDDAVAALRQGARRIERGQTFHAGAQPHAAGFCDAVLDYVQTREELAPGCYRVRAMRGAE